MPNKSILAAFREQLGSVPDQQIADRAKVSRTLVVNYRKRLGIPAYRPHRAGPGAQSSGRPFRGRRSALDAFLGQLGQVPDAEIARLAGVTAENVRTYRQRRNIRPLWKAGDPPRSGTPGARIDSGASRPKPAHAHAQTASPVGSSSRPAVFLVTVETDAGPQRYALLAADLPAAVAEATARLAAHPRNASIQAIERLAELLPV